MKKLSWFWKTLFVMYGTVIVAFLVLSIGIWRDIAHTPPIRKSEEPSTRSWPLCTEMAHARYPMDPVAMVEYHQMLMIDPDGWKCRLTPQ